MSEQLDLAIELAMAVMREGGRYPVLIEGKSMAALYYRGTYMVYFEDNPLTVNAVAEDSVRDGLRAWANKGVGDASQ